MHQTNYSVDKAKNQIIAERLFDAPVSLVWQAWTTQEILEQWWAPKPWRAITKTMDFKPGGAWFYAMTSPQDEKHWCRVDYKEIVKEKYYIAQDAFCDELGRRNMEMPSTQWHVAFTAEGDHTKVTTTMTFESAEALEKLINMGFKEGFAMGHQNLDEYIKAHFRLRSEMKTGTAQRVTTYLNFPGNTEEAMNFYKSVFHTEFIGGGIHRFGDIPQGAGAPPVADNVKNMVLHAELPITANHVLMATDAPKEMGMTLTQGNNMHICIEPGSREETERLFSELSAGGNVIMPLSDMFWGAYYAGFTDKYGINWMLNHTAKKD